MIELNAKQRVLLADKLPDIANIAAGAMVFGQVLGERPFSFRLALYGAAVWCFLLVCAIALVGRREER